MKDLLKLGQDWWTKLIPYASILNLKGTQVENKTQVAVSEIQVKVNVLTSPETKARIKSRNKQIEKVKEIQASIKKLQRLIK